MLGIENLLPIMQDRDVVRRGAIRPGDRHRRENLASLVQAGQSVMHHAQCLTGSVRADVGADGPSSAHGPASVRLTGKLMGCGGHVLGGGRRLARVSFRVFPSLSP